MPLSTEQLNEIKATGSAKFVDTFKARTSRAFEAIITRDRFGSTGYVPFLLLGLGTGSKWVGNRAMKALRSMGVRFNGELHEDSYKVQNTDLADDPAIQASRIAGGLATSADVYDEKEVFAVLKENAVGFDGQPMFGTHEISNEAGTTVLATFDNDIEGAAPAFFTVNKNAIIVATRDGEDYQFSAIGGTADSHLGFTEDATAMGWRMRGLFKPGFWAHAVRSKQPLNEESLEECIMRHASFKNDAGLPMNCAPTHLVVPTALGPAAKKILERDYIDGGDSNIYKNRLQLIVSDYL